MSDGYLKVHTPATILATSSEPEKRLPDPYGCAPVRPAHSVRRTTSIDVTWPKGDLSEMHFEGYGRDCYTGEAGTLPLILAMDKFEAILDRERTILDIESIPPREKIKQLIGVRGGGYLRQALSDALYAEQQQGTPLYQLLDDLAGTSLIASWAWSRWPELDLAKQLSQQVVEIRSKMEGICVGFRPGSSGLSDASAEQDRASKVLPLANPQDPDGWHTMPEHNEVSMRRARRIDVWLDGNIQISAGFQDSATAPEGGRIAVHEYSMRLCVDVESGLVNSVKVTPHVLPFPECPSAVNNLSKINHSPVSEFRTLILETFPRVEGCTHLNDALRALADVPQLIEELKRQDSIR